MVQEFQRAFDFVFDVFEGAEDVGVVLLEPPHSGETGEGPREFVPVQDPEIGQAQRQLSPGAGAVVEDQAGKRGVRVDGLQQGGVTSGRGSSWV